MGEAPLPVKVTRLTVAVEFADGSRETTTYPHGVDCVSVEHVYPEVERDWFTNRPLRDPGPPEIFMRFTPCSGRADDRYYATIEREEGV